MATSTLITAFKRVNCERCSQRECFLYAMTLWSEKRTGQLWQSWPVCPLLPSRLFIFLAVPEEGGSRRCIWIWLLLFYCLWDYSERRAWPNSAGRFVPVKMLMWFLSCLEKKMFSQTYRCEIGRSSTWQKSENKLFFPFVLSQKIFPTFLEYLKHSA